MVNIALIFSGTIFVFILYIIYYILFSIVSPSYVEIFSGFSFVIFLSGEIATSVNRELPLSLPRFNPHINSFHRLKETFDARRREH